MGNHTVGRAIGIAAQEALWTRRAAPLNDSRKAGDPDLGVEAAYPTFPQGAGSREAALEILDRICPTFRGADAEFDACDLLDPNRQHPVVAFYTDPHPSAALGMLLLEAFAPNGLADLPRYAGMFECGDEDEGEAQDAACDLHRSEVVVHFDKRYGFC